MRPPGCAVLHVPGGRSRRAAAGCRYAGERSAKTTVASSCVFPRRMNPAAPRPPPPAARTRSISPCGPSLRSRARHPPSRPREHVDPARRAVRQRRQRPDLRARRAARHRAGGHRRVGGRREEAALRVAQARPPSACRRRRASRGQPVEAVVQHRPSPRRPGDSSSSAESESTRYSTRVRGPARQDHRGLRGTWVRKVTGVAVGVGGARGWPPRGSRAASYPAANRTVRSVRRRAGR